MNTEPYERMRTNKKVPSRTKSMAIALLTVGLAAAFILHTDIVAEAVRDASHICADTVLPSLFPFLVLASFIVHSGLLRTSGRLLRPMTQALLNLPGEAGIAIILGLIGGFPVGPKMTAELYRLGEITKAQAQTMMLFTMGGGPAFVIGTVGVAMLGNFRSGVLLYASMVFASLTLGILLCMHFSKDKSWQESKKPLQDRLEGNEKSTGEALCLAVESGTNSIIAICAYVIIFAAVTSVIGIYVNDSEILNAITAVLEVTRGCKAYSGAAGIGGMTVIAAIISFGGICVHCQVFSCIHEVNLPYSKFLSARIACACLAALFCRTVLLLFPEYLPVLSNMAEQVTTDLSVSMPACVSLLLMSVLLVLDHK